MRVKLQKNQFDILMDLSRNYKNICGIDEVGRGPLAGPVVACAVIMGEEKIDEVKDSKKLSDNKRRILASNIYDKAKAIGFGICDNNVIDNINIRQATILAMEKAVLDLKDNEGKQIKPDLLLIDAETIDSEIDQIGIISGDDLVYQISCASILAKVYRDDLMIDYSEKYPGYMFEANKGYGTKKHYDALEILGVTDIHRNSFLKKYYEKRNNC